ncbi:MAG: DNA (cytosine-5-)-methyltransferase [Cyanobacteria bacterium]|nr:DNA (cytosine-5-)-methyltransferase [Cyanobacteria bacterium CG_2015-16_32_12]NCO78960.1 DNA (cytosine-5-)-methyltransferase [Cyanobacteria bacterium CG_2015-22_32_23]NCQ03087.1 DNA (cytosine-5-)-methyltransferase [Cyanobacteria bacterium CG_2015-09_32_10]NCQ42227.1 DNA (cytosine-5-)-methyltransferase [Cyanobacteria bacterium CG_2015-04_32_10]NCS83746.1 DNA (cytosine-5-)-methyltransferase [Cyanobacteria bacterium CG_2015-02_32_10]
MNLLKGQTFIDLFAGIGSFHQALNYYGAKCVFASEWDKYCQEIYLKNYGFLPEGDITKINENDIPPHDILCAGFPCQAFSISGKQLGFNDTRGTLFFDVARIANYHQPRLLILENVKNFATHDNGKTLKVIIKTLNNIGYDVFYKVLNASNFGVPQKRERIYILGFRKDLRVKNFTFPECNGKPTKLIDFCLDDSETKEFIINRHDIKFKEDIDLIPNIFGHYPQKPIRIGTINKGGQGERIYHQWGHAITLSAYGGGVGAKTGIYLINGKIRKLAPRECARITGFPDDFIINNSKNIAYKQFGNSIVVNVLKSIIQNVFEVNSLFNTISYSNHFSHNLAFSTLKC